MRSPLEIRNDAWECLQQAERAPARRDKAILLILAQGWASLAAEMERLGPQPTHDEPQDSTCAATDAATPTNPAHDIVPN
jgi:hypothetical protein